MIRWKRSWPDLSERMPMDVTPCSNGEYVPEPMTEEQRLFMRLQDEEAERLRRKLGMSRREFVRTSLAFSAGIWALRQMAMGPARAGHTTGADCIDNPVQLANLDGEFVFDIQTHHVDEDGLWKVTNPGFHAFFAVAWSQSSCGDLDRMECLGQYHYIKEVYMESSTTAGVLSAVPSSPDRNPLPTAQAADTARLINELAASQRTVLHSFVMPNRGYAGTLVPGNGGRSSNLQEELDLMTKAKQDYGDVLRAWKCYTPWGDIPNASGWFHDDANGRAMIEHALALGVPAIATHKGFALPSFDQDSAACRDIGVVARDYPDIVMIVYHSGFDGDQQAVYAGDARASSTVGRSVDGFIKALRENGWSARHFAPGGTPGRPFAFGDGDSTKHANVPNVYAEIGSTFRTVSGRLTTLPDGRRERIQLAHLLGKLIYFVGPKRVVWGTDSLWYGSPQDVINRLRNFPLAEETEVKRILAEDYHLPWGLDGDVDDPSIKATDPARTIRNGIFGRNAAVPYQVDPDAQRFKITCDQLTATQQAYVQNAGTEREARPMASNVLYGHRTRRELFAHVWPNRPWAP